MPCFHWPFTAAATFSALSVPVFNTKSDNSLWTYSIRRDSRTAQQTARNSFHFLAACGEQIQFISRGESLSKNYIARLYSVCQNITLQPERPIKSSVASFFFFFYVVMQLNGGKIETENKFQDAWGWEFVVWAGRSNTLPLCFSQDTGS